MCFAALAVSIAGCASHKGPDATRFPAITLAPAGSCEIDAMRMCVATGGATAAPSSSADNPGQAAGGIAPMPDSIEFLIPAGQAIKLMCYYDPQHRSITRADAAVEAPLTNNSVEYLNAQGFCAKK